MLLFSPLEQFVPYTLFAGVTNFQAYLGLSLSLVMGLMVLHNLHARVGAVTSGAPLVTGATLDSVRAMVSGHIGLLGERYTLLVVFLFVLLGTINLVGLTPYSYTPTSYLPFTLFLSVAIVTSCTLVAVVRHGFGFLAAFVPEGTPLALVPLLVVIETISYVARAFSLGIRLGANIVAGHSLLLIISGFVAALLGSGGGVVFGPLALALVYALFLMEFGVAVLQAYVFALLTVSYVHDALRIH